MFPWQRIKLHLMITRCCGQVKYLNIPILTFRFSYYALKLPWSSVTLNKLVHSHYRTNSAPCAAKTNKQTPTPPPLPLPPLVCPQDGRSRHVLSLCLAPSCLSAWGPGLSCSRAATPQRKHPTSLLLLLFIQNKQDTPRSSWTFTCWEATEEDGSKYGWVKTQGKD